MALGRGGVIDVGGKGGKHTYPSGRPLYLFTYNQPGWNLGRSGWVHCLIRYLDIHLYYIKPSDERKQKRALFDWENCFWSFLTGIKLKLKVLAFHLLLYQERTCNIQVYSRSCIVHPIMCIIFFLKLILNWKEMLFSNLIIHAILN